jgi:hypothetical protein
MVGDTPMASSDLTLSRREVLAITEWAKETCRICEVRVVAKPLRLRGPAKSDIGLAVTVSSVGSDDRGFGMFCSRAGDWQKQLRAKTGNQVSLWWFGPESPIYEYLRADAVLLWSRT